MTNEAGVVRGPRRTIAEVEQIVGEFEASGLNRSQFCQHKELKLVTLNRYLKRVRGKSTRDGCNSGLVAVELDGADQARGSGLSVVLAGGKRIEVSAGFDGPTLQRLVRELETV